MEHKFEYDGQPIVYRSGTVRDREARKLVIQKIYALCGGRENISELDGEILWDYSNHITHTTPFEAAWRRDVNESAEKIYEGFQLFAEAPGEDYDVFKDARNAALPPEKKS